MRNKSAARAAQEAGILEPVTSNKIAQVEAHKAPESVKQLTSTERKQLEKCEDVIEKGIKSFLEVAKALVDIRDAELYRETHKTFEGYCTQKWGITARHGNRLMLAGEVVSNIESDQLVSSEPAAIPENEAQARPLASLSKEEQVEAAKIVGKKQGKPSAKDFEEAANQVSGKKPKHVTKEEQSEVEDEEQVERPRVQCYNPKEGVLNDNDAMDELIELIDAAVTKAKTIDGFGDVAKTLNEIAKGISKRKNGGRK